MIDGKEYHSNLLKSALEIHPEAALPTLTLVQILSPPWSTGVFFPFAVPWPPWKEEVWSSDPTGPKPALLTPFVNHHLLGQKQMVIFQVRCLQGTGNGAGVR